MRALQYWKTVTNDRSDFLERLLAVFEDAGVEFCVIDGTSVTLDLDVAIAIHDLRRIEKALAEQFTVQRFAHSVNVAARDSDLRLQIQTDPRYEAFVARARMRDVLGLRLHVAAPEDVLQGKIWAVQDEGRRPSKRQKDLADISRLIEAEPALRKRVPSDVLARLIQ
jgi:hypothetical protein